jgi:hypothetical protein
MKVHNDKRSRMNNSVTKRRNNTIKETCLARDECIPGHIISHWLGYGGKLFIWEYEYEKMNVKGVLILQWALLSYCSRKRGYIASFYFSVSVSWQKYKAARLKYEHLHAFSKLSSMVRNAGKITSREFVIFQGIIGWQAMHTFDKCTQDSHFWEADSSSAS